MSTTENTSKKNDQKGDDEEEEFILPTAMLAPTHLWASSSDDDDDDADSNTNQPDKKKDNNNKQNNYLAPFVATPSSDCKFMIDSLASQDLLSFSSSSSTTPTNEKEHETVTICDIGTGDGSFLIELCNQLSKKSSSPSTIKIQAVGFDIDEEVIEVAQKNAERNVKENSSSNVETKFVVADVMKFEGHPERLMKTMMTINTSSSSSSNIVSSLDGIYIYLYPPAMKKIETVLAQLIDFHRHEDSMTSIQWIVTRRWQFFDELKEKEEGNDSLLKSKIKLVKVAKKDDEAVPFFIYIVL